MQNLPLLELKARQRAIFSISLLLILPFLVPWHLRPYMSFYQDMATMLPITFLVIIVARAKLFAFPCSPLIYYLIALACYWFFQVSVVDLPYPELNVKTGLFFIVCAMLAWCIQILIQQVGREAILFWVMWAVTLSAGIQAVVAILQFTGFAETVSFIVLSKGHEVRGQLGQPNLLGHQLMWGLLATIFLLSQQHIRLWKGILLIIFLGGVLGIIDSRAIVAYIIVLFLLLFVAILLSKGNIFKERFFILLGCSLLWLTVAQFLMPMLMQQIANQPQSGLTHLLENTNGGERLVEWQKAWIIFKEFPLFGAGWDTYAYQSLMKHELVVPFNQFRETGIASHCHNSILQIMAEMGGIGSLVTFGGLTYVLYPMVKNWRDDTNTVLLLLISVTLTHSLVEFPLWNSFFFTTFIVFIALGTPVAKKWQPVSRYMQRIFLVTASAGALVTLTLLMLNQWRVSQALKLYNGDMMAARLEAGYQLGSIFPLLTPHYDLGILRKQVSTKMAATPEDFARVQRLTRHFPNPHVAEHYGFNLYQQGNIEDSLDWMRRVWHHYPFLVPYSAELIYKASPKFKKLEQPVYNMCVRYKELNLYPHFFSKPCQTPPTE